jgi:protein-S-isoprenylcysteine O-methyltransferase Ste14
MLLGLWGLMGLPEVSSKFKGRLITGGPFSVVRHPTYLAHTLMFLGIFLASGVIAVAVITLFDLVLINIVIIPLEDRELLSRFGDEYKHYMQRVAGFFPLISHQ